ncbi:receptor-interacting serine/threonine-protein kinase 2 isoform X1 [Gadus macrocephalus]|uniref:receptor-interacting serine/threonine-protein kinase 2 isoform X1 n=1 Tax=Gadus macrocephalus TaxID=80720 RepID=UPI0028CB5656|nr:receptor-interacting serine/threonine-protein kinase 2 isoform X1 [Gadus macrocephalus]
MDHNAHHTHIGCVNIGTLTSTLPVIPYQKLTDLHYLSKGGFGTVFKAQHSDWRTSVAIKCLKIDSPVGERERNSLLKEAEVLHKARFNYIIQIYGVCNEPEFFCIVTEYMCNGSLDRLLHEKDSYPHLHWPLRLRILYQIALGVNFLHKMTPPLLHHDLKTQNILLDGEFHVKIADFGLSKWRQLSISKGSGSKPTEIGGTIIYMPPEEYHPNRIRKTDVKYDMYSYAIIMWEVLSRQIPFEDTINPMQIMFCVINGTRPDTGAGSLPADTPSRETLVRLMTCGWAGEPDDRPTLLQCLMELEPMLRRYDDIDFLEAVFEIKKSKRRSVSCSPGQAVCQKEAQISMDSLKESPRPWPESSTSSGSASSQETDISQPGLLTSIDAPPTLDPTSDGVQASFLCQSLERPAPLRDLSPDQDMNCPHATPTRPMKDPGHAYCHGGVAMCETLKQQTTDDFLVMPIVQLQEQGAPDPALVHQATSNPSGPQQGPVGRWMTSRREEIVQNMTEACLNQSLDALLARSLLMREDYELVLNQPTRTAKVRQLLDTAHRHSEDCCRLVVHTLYRNKQNRLQPYPAVIVSPVTPGPSAPLLSLGDTGPERR